MALILLVPILFPFVIALIAKRNASRTWVIPALVLELLLVIGCAFTRGSVVIPCIYGTQIVLVNDGLGILFSVLFTAMFLLAGIFGFEYLHEKINTYHVFYLSTLGAMVGL